MTLLSEKAAKTLAEQLNKDEFDDWTYEAVPCGNGQYWKIALYDEAGEFVTYFGV